MKINKFASSQGSEVKVKAVLFDLDGTLLDTSEFIYQAYEHA